MSQEKDVQLRLSMYELIIILGRIMKRDDNFKLTTYENIIAEARKFAR